MVRVDTLSESAAGADPRLCGTGPYDGPSNDLFALCRLLPDRVARGVLTIQSLIEILERQRGQSPQFCDVDLSDLLGTGISYTRARATQ